jgi:hypothetical protein
MLIHTEYDLADAVNVHSTYQLNSSQISLTVKQNRFTKSSTISRPCQKYWPKTCHHLYMQNEIAKEYNCRVPIFILASKLIRKDLPHCTNQKLVEIFKKEYSSSCFKSIPCEYSKYEMVETQEKQTMNNESNRFVLTFDDDLLEEIQSWSIMVDEQTLGAQLGGLLGILLGWSEMGIFIFLLNPLINGIQRSIAFIE